MFVEVEERAARRKTGRVIVLLSAVLVIAACAPDRSDPRAAQGESPAPIPPLASAPRRIVPTTTAAAEMVAALVDSAHIVALPEQVDGFATRDFAAGDLGRLPRFARYAAEPLLALRPDLVVTHSWQSQDTTAILRGQGIPVLVLRSGTDWDAARATLVELGRILGAEERSRTLLTDLDARVAGLRARAALRAARRALVYANDGTGGWAAGARTTADGLLRLAGLVNVAAEDGFVEHQKADFERVLRLDPDLFVVAAPAHGEGGSATAAVLLSAAPLAGLRAVRERRIAVLSSPLLSADSPAIVEAAEALERELLRVFP